MTARSAFSGAVDQLERAVNRASGGRLGRRTARLLLAVGVLLVPGFLLVAGVLVARARAGGLTPGAARAGVAAAASRVRRPVLAVVPPPPRATRSE